MTERLERECVVNAWAVLLTDGNRAVGIKLRSGGKDHDPRIETVPPGLGGGEQREIMRHALLRRAEPTHSEHHNNPEENRNATAGRSPTTGHDGGVGFAEGSDGGGDGQAASDLQRGRGADDQGREVESGEAHEGRPDDAQGDAVLTAPTVAEPGDVEALTQVIATMSTAEERLADNDGSDPSECLDRLIRTARRLRTRTVGEGKP